LLLCLELLLLLRDFLLLECSGDDRLRFFDFFLLESSLDFKVEEEEKAAAICLTLIPGAGLLGSSGRGTHFPFSSLSPSLSLSLLSEAY